MARGSQVDLLEARCIDLCCIQPESRMDEIVAYASLHSVEVSVDCLEAQDLSIQVCGGLI